MPATKDLLSVCEGRMFSQSSSAPQTGKLRRIMEQDAQFTNQKAHKEDEKSSSKRKPEMAGDNGTKPKDKAAKRRKSNDGDEQTKRTEKIR